MNETIEVPVGGIKILGFKNEMRVYDIHSKFARTIADFAQKHNVSLILSSQPSKVKYNEQHHINSALFAAEKHNLSTEVVTEIINNIRAGKSVEESCDLAVKEWIK